MKTVLFRAGNKTVFFAIGALEGAGSFFWVPVKPSRVIKFSPGNTYGVYLMENVATPTTPSSGEWGYRDNVVYLGDPLQEGEKVFALIGETFLFQDVNTLAGTPYYDVGKTEIEHRRKQQEVKLIWLSPAETLENVVVSFEDFLPAGSDISYYEVALDPAGPWSYSVQIERLRDHEEKTIYVRCTRPVNSSIGFFNDVALKVEGVRVFPGVQTVLLTGQSALLPLPYSHPYLIPWVLYEGQVRGAFPVIVYDSTQQKSYLLLRWEGQQNVVVRYFVQDVSHLTPTIINPSNNALSFSPSGPVMVSVVATSSSVAPRKVQITNQNNKAVYNFVFDSGVSSAKLYLYPLPYVNFISDEIFSYQTTLSQSGQYVWLSSLRVPYAFYATVYNPLVSHAVYWPCYFSYGAHVFVEGIETVSGQFRALTEN
ncbi:MAG: hypothetical protein QW794_03220 [Thermosphaera sp.]